MRKGIYSPNTLEQEKTVQEFANHNLKAPSEDGVFYCSQDLLEGKRGEGKKRKPLDEN